MAKYLVCAVRDAAVGAFTSPFLVRARGEATRGFIDAVLDPKMEFGKHPEDYVLYQVGVWDDVAGQYDVMPNGAEVIVRAIDCMAAANDRP